MTRIKTPNITHSIRICVIRWTLAWMNPSWETRFIAVLIRRFQSTTWVFSGISIEVRSRMGLSIVRRRGDNSPNRWLQRRSRMAGNWRQGEWSDPNKFNGLFIWIQFHQIIGNFTGFQSLRGWWGKFNGFQVLFKHNEFGFIYDRSPEEETCSIAASTNKCKSILN